MKDLSVEKQIYLCKYHDVDTSLCNTMGMKAEEIEETLKRLKANGLYDQYRKMDEFEYDRVIKVEKNKTRAEKILDKYRFDRSRSTYERMRQVLSECESIRDVANLNMTTVFRKIAQKEKVETYVINNDCKRAIDSAYAENENLFLTSGYANKPTLKEFIAKELQMKTEKEIKEKVHEVKEGGNKQLPEKVGSAIMIQIPIEQMYEYYYLKGFLDATEGNALRKFE